MEIQNAQIESTVLGHEGHGIMSFMIHLDFGGVMQGVGGYALGREGNPAYGIIKKILDTVDVETWEQLKGKYIRAKRENGRVTEIGHLMEDKWLNFKDYFENNNVT